MYVCLCNALTDADIRRATVSDGAQRPAEVFTACRCRAQCGSCVRTVCALIGGYLGEPLADRGSDAIVPAGLAAA